MTTPPVADFRTRAEDLVASVEQDAHPIPAEARARLVDALTHDLDVAADRATVNETQLKQIEKHTRLLAETLFALSASLAHVTSAVGTLRDGL